MQSQLEELYVLNLGIFIFDPKTDDPESFSITLQTEEVKDYPDPNLLPAAPIDARAPYAAIEKSRRNQDTTRRAEIIPSAKSRSVQIRRQFIKNMSGWLRCSSNLKILRSKTCILSREGSHQLTISKTDDSLVDAFRNGFSCNRFTCYGREKT